MISCGTDMTLSPLRTPIRTHEVGWPVIGLFLVASTALLVLLLQARQGALAAVLTGPSWRENLVLFGCLLVVAAGGVIGGVGRLRPGDVGLHRATLVRGVLTAVAVWVVIQLLAILEGLATGTLALSPAWSTVGVARTLRWTAVMFLATAFYEEITFRGFLFPQLYLKLRGSPRRRFWGALLTSQILFAVAHVPAHVALRHLSGAALWSQVVLQGIAGVMLMLLYLRSRNLWLCIGFHGLANAPTPLVRGTTGWEPFLLVLLVAWPWLMRRPAERGLAEVESLGPP